MVRPAARPGRPALSLIVRTAAVAGAVEIALRCRMRLDHLARLVGAPLEMAASPAGYSADAGLAAEALSGTLSGAPSRGPDYVVVEDRRRCVALVLRRWPFGDSCLRRALVLGALLRRFDPRLRVGVARNVEDGAQGVTAHAWLETTLGSFGHDGRSVPLAAR